MGRLDPILLAAILLLLSACAPLDDESALAKREGRSFKLSSLQPGHYEVAVVGTIKYLAIHAPEGEIKVFAIRFDGEKHYLPRVDQRLSYKCREFGPDVVSGKLSKYSVIRCQDSAPENWDSGKISYNVDGTPRTRDVVKLHEAPYRAEGGRIYVSDMDAPVAPQLRPPVRSYDAADPPESAVVFYARLGLVATFAYILLGGIILLLWKLLISDFRTLSTRRFIAILLLCAVTTTGLAFVMFFRATSGTSAPALSYFIVLAWSFAVAGMAGAILLLVAGWFFAQRKPPAVKSDTPD